MTAFTDNNDNRYPFLALWEGEMTLEYTAEINFAMVHNYQSPMARCIIHNNSDTPWRDVAVEIQSQSLKPVTHRIESISPHTSVDITKDLLLIPDADEMMRLTEPKLASYTILVTIGGEEAFKLENPLRLMAYDQWMGTSKHPEMLAAFVMPNHPLISRVLASASGFMEQWTGSGALDEYQSGDPNRARLQVAAVYEALRSEGLIYVSAKASFEESGQCIRTVDRVLTDKLGTCVDLTVLYASCLEAIGIQPILVLLRGHALVGAWLSPHIGEMIGDDADYLLKNLADGISELVVVETTLLTSSGAPDFEQAVEQAVTKLKQPENLTCYVNVAECRFKGIRPLPMRVMKDDQWVVVNDTTGRDNATTKLRRVDRYDLSAYDAEGATISKFTVWERKLLDFSLHNNLLNMKLGKRIIPIVSFNIDALEDELQAGKRFKVLPFPLSQVPEAPGKIFDSSLYPALEGPVTQQLPNGVIYSFHAEDALKDALKYVYRKSRTSLEENGANCLYLALGALKWYETEHSSNPRYAPILLLPIEIIRGTRGSGYTIRMRDEEIALNITLTEMLKQQHDIDLSCLNTLPTDHSGVDVKKIFAIIRDKILNKRGWNVIDEAMIGLFSFSKFVMWYDIHTNAPRLMENPIISSLVDGRLKMDLVNSTTDAREADRTCRPEEFTLPIDVDSSQLEAIIDSGKGHSFILHGPPGTGKSQTITNMIANALYQGKRVLFVAEKMAALSVVQARLEKIGLAPFCLELHSNKVTKQHFLEQMEMALNVVHGNPSAVYKEEADALYEKRCKLMDYVEGMHRRLPNVGYSLHDCIAGYNAIDGDEIQVEVEYFKGVTMRQIEQLSERIQRLDTIFRITGNPAQGEYRGLHMRDGSVEAERAVKKHIETGKQKLDQLDNHQLLRLLEDIPALLELETANNSALALDEIHRDLLGRYGQGIFSTDLGAMSREWRMHGEKWFLPRYFGRRSMLKRYAMTAPDVEYLIVANDQINQHQATLYPFSAQLEDIFGNDRRKTKVEINTCIELKHVLEEIERVANIEVDSLKLPEAFGRWARGSSDMRSWYLWCKERDELSALHLQPVIDYILQGKHTGEEASKAFLKGLYRALAVEIINSREDLRFFNGLLFDKVVDEYRHLTSRFQQLSMRELYMRLASRIPSMAMEALENSEVGILKRNIRNGGRGNSIRRIIDQIPTLLPKLCPCMLMSPLSVAQYLDINSEKVDLVIFDEASQMPTSEAVGAIARGKALIVVGDPKQMPPTSFFTASSVSEDEAAIDDMESILDDCLAMSIPSRYLTWHYRSKHESLIAFSNSQYYGGRLLTFPSVDDQARKVSLRTIEGVYQRSGARVNLPEAQAVVAEVLSRLADPLLSKRSIGIVSFSKVQQDKIEDLLTDELAHHPELETLAYDSPEPIFIKNLENVQGDERDVILFSVGYGPDKNGKVSMNFGPLNKAGGERRLNVAVSRARYEMIVFSSLHASQIDMRRSNALGVEGLKKFLEFAESGQTSILADNMVSVSHNSVAERIAQELGKRGFKTKLGVGRSQFRVDIAVVDPERADRYLLGIMLDGDSYYATKTMRDREIVQPAVLRLLKWKVMRVWTLDWFERPQEVIDSIVSKLGENEPEEVEETFPTHKINFVEDVLKKAPKVPEVKSSIKGYVRAKILEPVVKLNGPEDLSRYAGQVMSHLRQLIDVEQPITSSLLYKRIVKIWGLSRVSSRVQTLVDNLLNTSGLYGVPDGVHGRVWWTNQQKAEEFEGYRGGGVRDIMDIPTLEVKNAMKFVVDQQVALDREDLKRLTSSQLGFTRKGANIDTVTDAIVDALEQEGYFTIVGTKVSKLM